MNQYAIIGAALVAVVALGGFLIWLAFRNARKRGEAEQERDHFEAKTEQARQANEIDEDVSRLSGSDLDDELRNGG